MELKALGRNTLIYAIGNIGLRAVSFLLIPLYAHLLTQAEFGALYTILFTLQAMLVLTNLGIRESLTRFAGECRGSGRMGELMGSALAGTLAGGAAVSAAALLFLAPFLSEAIHSESGLEYLAIAAAVCVVQALGGQLINYYRATNQPVRFMAIGLALAVLLVAANVVTLWWLRMGIRGALLAQLAAYSLGLVGTAAMVLPRTGLGFSWKMLRRVVSYGAPLVAAEFCMSLVFAAPAYLLGRSAGLETVAIYSLGFRLAQGVSIVLILPFDLAFAPFVFANLQRANIRQTMSRAMTFFALAFAAVSFAALLAARELIPVIAPGGYSGALLVLAFLLPAIAFEGLNAFGKTLLLIEHRTRLVALIALAVGALSLGLNLGLVGPFGLYGAVAATDLALAAMALAVTAAGLRRFAIELDLRRIAAVALGSAALVGVFLALREAPGRAEFYGALGLPTLALLGVLYVSRFFSAEEKQALHRMLRGGLSSLRRRAAGNASIG